MSHEEVFAKNFYLVFFSCLLLTTGCTGFNEVKGVKESLQSASFRFSSLYGNFHFNLETGEELLRTLILIFALQNSICYFLTGPNPILLLLLLLLLKGL